MTNKGDIYIIMNVSDKKAKEIMNTLEEIVVSIKNNKELSTTLRVLSSRLRDDT